MPAIKDVAKLAGFSPAAVSKYLKNPNSVRPETKERIEAAIRELNYLPSAAARSLRTGKSNLYLLMVSHLKNPYFVEQFMALNEEANRRNFSLLVQSARLDENDEWNENADFYVPSVQQVDGIILMIAKAEEVLDQMRTVSATIPVVAYSWPYACPGLDTVVVDMEGAIYASTCHLLEQGHTRIGYISDHRQSYNRQVDKVAGYRRALKEYDVPERSDYFCITTPSVTGGHSATEKLMTQAEPPTAIVCENDTLALGCLEYAREHGISVPEDLAVTGQDDSSFAQLATPKLTSSSAPDRIMAATAFDMLSARRENFDLPQQCVVYRSQLIVRESSQYSRLTQK